MSLRFTPRALAEAKRVKTWWRRNRPTAPDLFEQEFAAALDRIAQAPGLGRLYEEGDLDVPVGRVLLPKTLNHVYYAIGRLHPASRTRSGAPPASGSRRP
jgi:plasmid stabilization system protein ParE